MTVRAWMLAIVLPACGGGPALRNVPQPNAAVVAGAAAAVAGAATLADPQGQARRVEQNKVPDEKKPQRVKATVPSDVFDRLDHPPPPEPPPAPPPATTDGDNDDGTPLFPER